jgi:hypothetical protein
VNFCREIGAGGLRPPSGGNLKRKMLIEHFVIESIFPVKCSDGVKRSVTPSARLAQAGCARRQATISSAKC